MELGIDIMAYVRGVLRRWWLVAAIFIVGAGAALVVAMKLPSTYESTARILVESQQIPDDLARSTVTASAAERLQIIQQRLMTRRNLLEIIELLDLFADHEGMSLTEKVEAVRAATRFESITFSGGARGVSPQVAAFTITYSSGSAATASRVANEFVTRVLEQNLEARSERATETRAFFRQEVDRLATELLQLETEISGFQNENVDALPQSLEFRLSEISSLQDRLFASEQRRAQLADERRFLETALEDGATPLLEGATPLSPIERDLADLRRVLLQQRSVLSESHPTIRALEAQVQAIEASLDGQTPAEDEEADAEAAPPRFAEVRSRLEAIDRQAARLVEEEGRLATRIETLQASVDRTPEIQMNLSAMERRYASLQEQYQGAVARLAEAAIGERLEINRQAERFEVIEQASVPEAPVKPNRKLIAAAGVVGSFGLGMALALMLEILNPAIRSAADLQHKLDLRPIVSVPYISTQRELVRQRVGWLASLGLIGAGGAGLLWAADRYYLPLSVLVERVAEKAGLQGLLQQIQGLMG